jgi:Protein of unknown function (DUF1153)
MTELLRPRVKYVIGPDGSPLTIADLPPPSTRRWVIRRKAEVVAAVRGGLLSLEEACQRYTLTVEEFLSCRLTAMALPACAPPAFSTIVSNNCVGSTVSGVPAASRRRLLRFFCNSLRQSAQR